MDLSKVLNENCILLDVEASSKREFLEKVAAKAAESSGLHAKEIFDALLQRERLGTTGTGDGVAIPHSRFGRIDRLYGVFARLKTPIDFESVDDKPVDIAFTLLAPESAGADHLKALAQISRLFREKKILAELRNAKSQSSAYSVLTKQLPEANAA